MAEPYAVYLCRESLASTRLVVRLAVVVRLERDGPAFLQSFWSAPVTGGGISVTALCLHTTLWSYTALRFLDPLGREEENRAIFPW